MKIRDNIRITGITLSFICVIYYSYLPFLYVIDSLPIGKNTIFISLISLSLLLWVFYYFISGGHIHKKLMIVIGLYSLFSIYTVTSFVLSHRYSDNLFTVRTLCVINPIFIVLAFMCRNEKPYFVTLLYLVSFSYLLFVIYAYVNGRIVIQTLQFQDIFGVTKTAPYLDINLYLGILAVLATIRAKNSKKALKAFLLYCLLLSDVMAMLVIGGRSSLCAAIIVATIFYYKENFAAILSGKLRPLLPLVWIVFFVIVITSFAIGSTGEPLAFWRFSVLFKAGDSSKRLFLFSNAIDLFVSSLRNLFIGAGMGYFPIYIGANSPGWYPHNIILELLSEYGILGTMLFLSPVFYILSYRKSKLGTIYGKTVTEKSTFLLAIYFWIISMVSGALRSSWVLIFFTFLLAPSNHKICCVRRLTDQTKACKGS